MRKTLALMAILTLLVLLVSCAQAPIEPETATDDVVEDIAEEMGSVDDLLDSDMTDLESLENDLAELDSLEFE